MAFNVLEFVADNAGLDIFKALEKAYEQGKADSLGKDTNVPTNSALDHIHNVVRDDAYRRGYEQGNADANHPEFPDSCNTETVEAIPVPWIESYALLAEADGRPFFAEGIRDMVEEWKQEQKG